MADAVLDGAETYAERLPRPVAAISALLGSAAHVLDEVAAAVSRRTAG
ncbi:hypothetical protein OG909_17780 [Streptomyces sp. NBC_01754]|nr:hypothetical protein [Streptomyces sp. NBC_01754]WSC93971.1 hypothetical protein OG909_17780 [Streptomyces sp. NBC_01754]